MPTQHPMDGVQLQLTTKPSQAQLCIDIQHCYSNTRYNSNLTILSIPSVSPFSACTLWYSLCAVPQHEEQMMHPSIATQDSHNLYSPAASFKHRYPVPFPAAGWFHPALLPGPMCPGSQA